MKKLFMALTAMLMVLSLAACGNDTTEETTPVEDETVETEGTETEGTETEETEGTEAETEGEATEEVVYVDGEYEGVGTGMGGDVKVKVTVADGKIASVEVLEHAETEGVCEPAIEGVPAAIEAANSTEVDTVSGATVTSNAIIEAVNNALSK